MTINGNNLPCTPPPEGGAASSQEVSGSYSREGSTLTIQWQGAGQESPDQARRSGAVWPRPFCGGLQHSEWKWRRPRVSNRDVVDGILWVWKAWRHPLVEFMPNLFQGAP